MTSRRAENLVSLANNSKNLKEGRNQVMHFTLVLCVCIYFKPISIFYYLPTYVISKNYMENINF